MIERQDQTGRAFCCPQCAQINNPACSHQYHFDATKSPGPNEKCGELYIGNSDHFPFECNKPKGHYPAEPHGYISEPDPAATTAAEPQRCCGHCSTRHCDKCPIHGDGGLHQSEPGSTRPDCPLTSEDGQQFKGELKEAREALKDLEGTRPITVDPNWCEVHQVIMSSCEADRRKGCRMGTRPEKPPAERKQILDDLVKAEISDGLYDRAEASVQQEPLSAVVEKIRDVISANRSGCNEEIAEILAKLSIPAAPRTQGREPIQLNHNQETLCRQWAADDRLWTTQETVEFNLKTFARSILVAGEARTQPAPKCPKCGSGEHIRFFAQGGVPRIACIKNNCTSTSKVLVTAEDLSAFFTALPEAQPTPEWISVKDLPGPLLDDFEGRFSATLQLFDSANNYWLGFYDFKDSKWWIHQGYEDDAEVMPIYQITHWQPLPSPPEPTPTKKEGQ